MTTIFVLLMMTAPIWGPALLAGVIAWFVIKVRNDHAREYLEQSRRHHDRYLD